jgi:hypothetical protein
MIYEKNNNLFLKIDFMFEPASRYQEIFKRKIDFS